MPFFYPRCPSNVQVFDKVPSNSDEYKKELPYNFIEFVGIVVTDVKTSFQKVHKTCLRPRNGQFNELWWLISCVEM